MNLKGEEYSSIIKAKYSPLPFFNVNFIRPGNNSGTRQINFRAPQIPQNSRRGHYNHLAIPFLTVWATADRVLHQLHALEIKHMMLECIYMDVSVKPRSVCRTQWILEVSRLM